MLKIYATIANIGLDFVPCVYPTASAFGSISLPGAFVYGQPVGTEGIIAYLRSIVDIDSAVAPATTEERAALAAWSESVLKDAIDYTLWGSSECYSKFTLPVMTDSMPRPYADRYCSHLREQWMNRDLELIDSKLRTLLSHLNNKLLVSKFFFSSRDDAPSFCDVMLYSYLSVLLSIPEKFSPLFVTKDESEESKEIVHRLKSFLLDFDDWLWLLNSKRVESAVSSALPAAAGKDAPAIPILEEESTATPQVAQPLLGTESARTQNLLFLGAAGVVFAGVMLVSHRNALSVK